MESDDVVFSVLYGLFAVCLVFPPTEFVASGLTLQSLFAGFLGSEDQQFIQYHLRRTALHAAVHACLPLGFFLGLWWTSPEHFESDPNLFTVLPPVALLGLLLSGAAALVVLAIVARWRADDWRRHPTVCALQLYAGGRVWRTVASDVNVEFRRVHKFATAPHEALRVVATDSWLIRVAPYSVKLLHQSDAVLSVEASDEHQLAASAPTGGGVQVITIRVDSVRREIAPFTVRLNALDYKDFREKLNSPIRNARNIVIRQTLGDRFVDAFKTQAEQNPRYVPAAGTRPAPSTDPTEPCIGCMQNAPNVKLHKLCDDNLAAEAAGANAEGGAPRGACLNCYCRPMWCVDCMGKWFASRQDQTQPDTWLSSKSPCPTCRATFCVLDVCLLPS